MFIRITIMNTNDLVCSSARQKQFLLLQLALSLGSTALAVGQQGYQVQGQHPPATLPSAYAQRSYAPAPGTGLQGYPQQPQQYQTPSGYGQNPYVSNSVPTRQQYKPSKPSSRQQTAPAYQPQAPAQQSLMPNYPAYGQQPVPYPQVGGSSGLSSLNGGARPVRKSAPTTVDGSLAAQVASLKSNDRLQDRRIADLERHAFPAASSGRSSGGQHQVILGDSLSSIASRYGTSVDEIKRLNNRTSNVVLAGEVLKVPGKGGKGSYEPSRLNGEGMSVPAKSVQSGTHIVQRGESLGAIAAAYRISLKSLQDANGIRNANLITPGQRLRIPGSKSGVIASGKSRVASKQYVSSPPKPVKSRETVVYANVPAAGSGVGQVIEPTGPRGVTSYRVEQGDTIESVANSFASTPSEIQRINKLASPRLPAVGDEIVVPLPGSVSL